MCIYVSLYIYIYIIDTYIYTYIYIYILYIYIYVTQATLVSPGKDETRVCGYIHTYIYIYIYIYTFSSCLLQHCKIYYFVSQCMFSHALQAT